MHSQEIYFIEIYNMTIFKFNASEPIPLNLITVLPNLIAII